ncbi:MULTISPECIES: galactofuranose ABC transporter, permease protein YjfF [Silvimonas]|uniref:galactofuranose ABC transporter, permease protein YjfF n=1 Tax=Silvimonas TaxID=300264 RepID=UPI0024B35A9E|nr:MULTISPECIES: galactofuranose ABC transporter, permease protein YjfF [Silvimonas]MDR3426632.1 sugar ABC transporter permease YjfF [Silvimonas sp.]
MSTFAKSWLRTDRLTDVRTLPLLITLGLFLLMFAYGSVAYRGFFSLQVFFNLFIDNAFLLIVAIGMTFVVISGGIDLSVGGLVAVTTMISATLVQSHHWPIWVVTPLVLAIGAAFGAFQGVLIQYFRLQPFIVTLGGLFLTRGLCFLINIESITISDPAYTAVSEFRLHLPGADLSANVLIATATFVAALWLAHYSEFGRVVYAIGGSERSALLMGLPVARTKVLVYTLSGFCAALGGVTFTFYMLSGYGLHAQGMELDAIAATVIGGTLLTGGVGYVTGTLFGVLILGVIQTLITFDGTLSSWWTRIVIGALLCAFCVMQRLLERHTAARRTAHSNVRKVAAPPTTPVAAEAAIPLQQGSAR